MKVTEVDGTVSTVNATFLQLDNGDVFVTNYGTGTALNNLDIASIEIMTITESSAGYAGFWNSQNVDPTTTTLSVCFTFGTMIETQNGEKLAEQLEVGDMIKTLDRGFQPVRFVARSRSVVTPTTRPVIFEKGAIGNDRVLRVSQKHRFLTTPISQYFNNRLDGHEDQLVWAQGLCNGTTIRIDAECTHVGYVHIMMDNHELVYAHGTISESWQPHKRNLKRDEALRKELLEIFPEIEHKNFANGGAPVRNETLFQLP